MRNVTVAITDEVYRRARMAAAKHNTSISALVEYLLETLPAIRRMADFPITGSKVSARHIAIAIALQEMDKKADSLLKAEKAPAEQLNTAKAEMRP
jgi:hypothetical protein